MNNIKAIREQLGVTQAALAKGIGCTQGNIWHYEQGQTIPPDAAERLITFAASLGCSINFNDVYATKADPVLKSQMAKAAKAGLIERRTGPAERRAKKPAKNQNVKVSG